MNRPEGYNSPKGVANNAAQKQGPAKGSPITKQAVQPEPKPVMPTTTKPTEKGNK